MLQPQPTNALPHSRPQNGTNRTPRQSTGSDAACLSHSYNRSSIQAIRGTHVMAGMASKSTSLPMDLVISEFTHYFIEP